MNGSPKRPGRLACRWARLVLVTLITIGLLPLGGWWHLAAMAAGAPAIGETAFKSIEICTGRGIERVLVAAQFDEQPPPRSDASCCMAGWCGAGGACQFGCGACSPTLIRYAEQLIWPDRSRKPGALRLDASRLSRAPPRV